MAFDLVARLKLQDDFTSRLKKVGQQLDKTKSKVEKASKSTKDMGSKFSSVGIVASSSLGKMGGALDRVKSVGKRSMQTIRDSAGQLPGKFKGVAGKIKNSLSSGIRGPAISAKNAIIGIGSAVGAIAVVSKAFNMMKASIDGAISRYDTLNNFPKVME